MDTLPRDPLFVERARGAHGRPVRVVSLRRPEDVEPVGIRGRGDLPPIGPVCASGLDRRRGGRFTVTAVARVSSIWRRTVVIPHRCSSRGQAIYAVATSDVVVPKPGGRGMPARPNVDLQGPGGGSRGRRRPGAPQPARNSRSIAPKARSPTHASGTSRATPASRSRPPRPRSTGSASPATTSIQPTRARSGIASSV